MAYIKIAMIMSVCECVCVRQYIERWGEILAG